MKTKKSKISGLVLLLIIFFTAKTINSQKNITESPIGISNISYYVPPCKTNSPYQQSSAEIESLEKELLASKQNGNRMKMIEIQNKLDRLTGSVSLNFISEKNFKILPPVITDNINDVRLLTRNNIKCLALSVEQKGITAGRIWIAVGIGGTSNNDTLRFIYSDNNGFNWIVWGSTILGGYIINRDEADIEIIENPTGEKFIWAVYGITEIQSNTHKIGFAITTTTGYTSVGTLGWPNTNQNVSFYRPRLISDNAFYTASSSWMYIAACRDSVRPGQSFTIASQEWVARCNRPDTTLPTIIYKPERFGYTTIVAPSFQFDDYCDIAYYRNGGLDSIIVTESNLPDSTYIYLAKTSISNFVNGGIYYAAGGVQPDTKWKRIARIAANGPYPNLMIVSDEQVSFTNWDIICASSLNGAGSIWSYGPVDNRSNTCISPDIIGRRNAPGNFYLSYSSFGSFDSVISCSATGNTWGTRIEPLNHISTSLTVSPKPGFRYVQNDSCLTVWTQDSNKNVWAANGCSGQIIIGLHNNNGNTPGEFSLGQNYPNPFNPVTNIHYNLPVKSNVSIVIYDILGKEVLTLVNETLEAGYYEISFDASQLASGIYYYRMTSANYTDVKKMAIVK